MVTKSLPVRYNRPANDELHPWIYRAIVGLTIWLVLSVWALFSRGAYEGLTLSVITLFFVILVGIPVILWLTWREISIPPNNMGISRRSTGVPVVRNLDRRRQRPRSIDANPAADRSRRLRHDNLRPDVPVRGSAPRIPVIKRERSASNVF